MIIWSIASDIASFGNNYSCRERFGWRFQQLPQFAWHRLSILLLTPEEFLEDGILGFFGCYDFDYIFVS
jgi:hypothetical protein